jgi:hypothetical protein
MVCYDGIAEQHSLTTNKMSAMSATIAATSGTFHGGDLRNSALKIDLIHRFPGSR